jgi:uncharacterized protein (DUF697 family)
VQQGDSRRKRIDRALEQSRTRLGVGAKELGDVLRRSIREITDRAQRSSKGERSSGASTSAGNVDQAVTDPAAFFSEERQRAAQELGHANILITGQTGVGKSTLVNAIFRVPLADEAIGRPVTKRVQRHDSPGVPVTIFDTPGVELGDARSDVIRDFKKTIARSRKGSPGDLIHVVWYCIDAGQTRIQDYDVEIVRALADEAPVLVVFTQCIDDERADALESAIAVEKLPIEGRPVRTLAKARRLAGETLQPRGLEDLVQRTNDILPEAVRRAFVNAQGVVVGLKVTHARTIVGASGLAAAGVGATPIPVPDAAVLMPVQLGMLAGITAVFGVDMSTERTRNLIRGLVGQGGVAVVGRQMAAGLLKVVPGVSFINASVAGALTVALGEAYIQLCSEMLRRQAAGKPMPDAEMLTFLFDAYQKAFKAPRARRGKAAPPGAPPESSTRGRG